jgi:hypothetical protein
MDPSIRSKMHPQCGGEVPLHCQQELHAQGFLGVHTRKYPEDSNLTSVEAMQWVLLYLSVVMTGVIEHISHNMAKINDN